MSVGRGRVLKAGQVTLQEGDLSWALVEEAKSAPAEVEVIREGDAVQIVRLRCSCSRIHELELCDFEAKDQEEKTDDLPDP